MLTANHHPHGRAIAKAAKCFFNPECDYVISNHRGDRLLGGVIFTRFTKTSLFMHAAGFDPYWFNRDMLWMTFHYPFEQLELVKAFVQITSDNCKSLDFTDKLGFKEVARIVGVSYDIDLVVKAMHRDECRWLTHGSRR